MSTYRRSARPCAGPSARKLTASTITTASISVRTNSLTERATASGWSCTCASSMPTGSSSLDALDGGLRERLAQLR